MARVFKTRAFVSVMKKSAISDADLGGGVVKKRVAIPGQGKSGGARTLLATNRGSRWFFVYGFLKNERANVSPTELEALKLLAADLLALRDVQIDQAVAAGQLMEICRGR